MIYFEKSTILPVKASELYRWHMRPEAFETLTPPWEPVKVLQRPLVLEEGSELHLQVPLGPLRILWIARHIHIQPGRRFDDIQVKGPFGSWHHKHLFEPVGEDATCMRDSIECSLPAGSLLDGLLGWTVRKKLQRMFDYRHQQLLNLFDACTETRENSEK